MTKELDITSEEFRVYTYANGSTFRVTHRPERGFVGISWAAKDGQPKFVA